MWQMHPWSVCGLILAMFVAAGCSTTPDDDSNTQVFRTPEELLVNRTAQQRESWRSLAVTILEEERPGIGATAGDELMVRVSADGAEASFDLAPLEQLLTAQNDRADVILRDHLRKELVAFDQERLARWPYERAKPHLRPMFISGSQLVELSEANPAGVGAAAGATPTVNNYAGGIRWVVAIQWQPGTLSPVGSTALRAWNKPIEELTATALANVAGELEKGEVFETTPIGVLGRSGALKPGVNPAVVISPAFLAAVRKQWQTADDLALLIATPNFIQFTEAKNTKLLDVLYPGFKELTQAQGNALAQAPVRLGDEGVVAMEYKPTVFMAPAKTQPTRSPLSRPTSRPTGTYIVN